MPGNQQTLLDGKVSGVGRDRPNGRPVTFSPIRHRLLLSLSLAPGLTVRELAAVVGMSVSGVFHHIARLRGAGLVEQVTRGATKTGYQLQRGVVVSEKGFVGRFAMSCIVFDPDGPPPQGMWVRERRQILAFNANTPAAYGFEMVDSRVVPLESGR